MAPGTVLARVNFPLFAVKMLTPRHILVAGGGGGAKCGVENCVEIYELSFNGKHCCARPATRYSLGKYACMNCTTWFNGKYHVLAAGLDGYCQLYQVQYKVMDPRDEQCVADGKTDEANGDAAVRQRRRSSNSASSKQAPSGSSPDGKEDVAADNNSNSVVNQIGFDFLPGLRVQTDFTPGDPYQKVVRVSSDGKYLVTGGCDGHVRIWKYPELVLHKDIEAHAAEVADLDIHPNGKKIVSTSHDGKMYMWSVETGEQLGELRWDAPTAHKYRTRNCRFGITEQDKSQPKVFSIYVPLVRKNMPPSFLIKWDSTKFVSEKVKTVEDATSMAVSDDGRFVAVGSISGSISIYIAFSLQRVYRVSKAHSHLVTGLEFIPSSDENLQIVGDQDASLISISLDNRIQIHSIPKPATISIRMFCYVMFLLLFLTFTLMSYLGL